MVFEEIPVDVQAIFFYFFCIPRAWNTEEIPPVFLKKHDKAVLSGDYTNLFSSTLVKLRLEKEKLQKWIFETQNNVLNYNTYRNIYLNHTGITTYCTYITINHHITSKITFYRNILNTNCSKSRNKGTPTTTITNNENVDNHHLIVA